MKVEILGPGCTRCRATKDVVRSVLEDLGLQAEIVLVSDPREYARRGVMLTPGVIVDGEVKVSGRVPEPQEVRHWFVGSQPA